MKARILRVVIRDKFDLIEQPLLVEPIGLDRRFRVVGDAEIIEPELMRLVRHLGQRVLAVAPIRVAMERAAQLRPLEQARNFAFLRRLDFAHVLAQLGGIYCRPRSAKISCSVLHGISSPLSSGFDFLPGGVLNRPHSLSFLPWEIARWRMATLCSLLPVKWCSA